MAMNKAVQRAINALTRLSPDVKRTYKAERGLERVSSVTVIKPPDYEVWDNHIARESGGEISVRIYNPGKEPVKAVLLFFHGGGWVLGNIDSYGKLCLNLARHTGCAVVSVDYRLAPEHPFPAGAEDCYAVARELHSGGILGIKPENITLIGDSAGGNLSAAVSLMARDRGEFLPQRQILIYPSTYNDYTESSPFASVAENGFGYLLTAARVSALLGMYRSSDEDLASPYFAPLMAADFSRQPKTLILTAEYDLLRDEGEYYGRKLLEAGNDVTVRRILGTLHGFMSLSARFSSVREAYDIINEFLFRS